MSYQNNAVAPVSESNLLNVEYLPNNSYRADTSKGVEVHKAINAIQAEILEQGGIAKSSSNDLQRYKYRSITAIYAVITPLMVKHKITCVGSTERSCISQFFNNKKEVSFKAIVQIRYIFTSIIDGSVFEVVMMGEANDTGDKALTKATTSAQKNMYNQIFAIPTGEDQVQEQHWGNNNGYQNNRNQGYRNQNNRNQNNHAQSNNSPNWGVKDNQASQPKSEKLASPELKDFVRNKLKGWGMDLDTVVRDIGLNMNHVTDTQMRNIFDTIRQELKAKSAPPVQ